MVLKEKLLIHNPSIGQLAGEDRKKALRSFEQTLSRCRGVITTSHPPACQLQCLADSGSLVFFDLGTAAIQSSLRGELVRLLKQPYRSYGVAIHGIIVEGTEEILRESQWVWDHWPKRYPALAKLAVRVVPYLSMRPDDPQSYLGESLECFRFLVEEFPYIWGALIPAQLCPLYAEEFPNLALIGEYTVPGFLPISRLSEAQFLVVSAELLWELPPELLASEDALQPRLPMFSAYKIALWSPNGTHRGRRITDPPS